MEKGKLKKEKLSYEDNSELLPLAKGGSEEAMNRLIEANLPLVTSIRKKIIKSLAKKLHFDKEALTKKLNRDPSIEELAEFSGIDKEEILFALESSASMQYLYEVIHQDDGAPVLLIDKLSENAEEDKNLTERIALKEALNNLDVKSRQIIVLRYFKDKTQIQVAKMLGISQVQVSRIEKKVLLEMRKQLDEG